MNTKVNTSEQVNTEVNTNLVTDDIRFEKITETKNMETSVQCASLEICQNVR